MRSLAIIATVLAIPFGFLGLALIVSANVMSEILGALLLVGFMLCLVVLAVIASAERIISSRAPISEGGRGRPAASRPPWPISTWRA